MGASLPERWRDVPDAPVRVIVRFASGTDPADAGTLRALGDAVSADIAHLRTLSVGAHVLSARTRDGAPPMTLLQRLRARPEIVDVQLDRTLRGPG
jgi:hypothetical protein